MRRILILSAIIGLAGSACAKGGTGGVLSSPSAGSSAGSSMRASPSELPAIVVDRPRRGDTVSSPVTISGSADVFEATVSIRILDARGQALVTTFTTATCGTGCRGTFSAEVPYRVDSVQPGTIEVFESSAENAAMLSVVEIPVTLEP